MLAEDVVGPDGSFVLHPKQEGPVTGPVFIDAGGRQLSLANDYASWMQDHLGYRADVTFPCEDAPLRDAVREEPASAPARPPPSLIPQRPL